MKDVVYPPCLEKEGQEHKSGTQGQQPFMQLE